MKYEEFATESNNRLSLALTKKYPETAIQSRFFDGLKNSCQYIIAAAIFIIYGIQVCPFLENLDRSIFISIVLSLFTSMLAIRILALRNLNSTLSIHGVKKQLVIDNGIFLLGGIILAIGNQLVYDFPLVSSLRVIIGVSILGLFISLQLYIQQERKLIRQNPETESSSSREISIGTSIQFLMLTLLSITLITMLLLIYKDFEWLQSVGEEVSLEQATLWIFYEFIFVCLVITTYGWLIIHGFAGNIKLRFELQNRAMTALKAGERNVKLTVTSDDEFRTLAEHTNFMIESLKISEETLKNTRDATIYAIASLAETRDNETGAHILRTQAYVKVLGEYLQKNPEFTEDLSDQDLTMIYKSAPLHDIGKVGISDAILLKPGKLTPEEFAIMKTHPIIGHDAIEKTEQKLGELAFLRFAKEISISHHEKWDGSGYPYGLKGKAIPLSGRLMALADVYDALITKRVYKPAFSHEKSRELILAGRGKHFDPQLVDGFLAVEQSFVDIAETFKDE